MSETLKPVYKFVQSRLDDAFYSPDSSALFRKKWHPLFVYGSLKRGFNRHQVLEDSYFLGSGFTRNTGWTMYQMKGKHPFPIVFTPQQGDTPGSIYGEVYLVSPQMIKTLDMVESNGILYSRQYRTIDLHTRKDKPVVLAAWIYLSERSVWKEPINNKICVPCEHFKRKDDPNFKYYLYKKDNECPVAESATTPQTQAALF